MGQDSSKPSPASTQHVFTAESPVNFSPDLINALQASPEVRLLRSSNFWRAPTPANHSCPDRQHPQQRSRTAHTASRSLRTRSSRRRTLQTPRRIERPNLLHTRLHHRINTS
ncbi:MAG: hypothetical protein Q9183_004896 [Haloplaca sp. 2 TL-2023]